MTTLYSCDGFRWDFSLNEGEVKINTYTMHCPAWNLPDLSPLYGTPEQRGRNRLLPGVVGTIPKRRRNTETTHSLRFIINGYWDRDGNVNADPWEGLEANMVWLQEFILLPTNIGDGTQSFEWITLGGRQILGDVHVLPLREPSPVGEETAALRTTLDISDPHGELYLAQQQAS